jgi:dTDP-4-dehydrorhamnose 3,5-epimerase
MIVIDTALDGAKIIEPKIFGDARGYFFESWNEKNFKEAGIDCRWVQDNESKSRAGVLRGLHYQAAPYTQAKLVRVIEGAVLDVALDIRKGSPTFGKHVAVELSARNKRQLFVPRGFAHGFVVLSDEVIFAYKCDNSYMPSHERGIAFDDPALGIDWKIDRAHAILSEKDTKNPLFRDAEVFDYEKKEYLR